MEKALKLERERFFIDITKITWITVALLSSIFLSGACGLTIEHIQGTVAVFILGGNSTQIYILVYGIMMFAMGIAGQRQIKVKKENLVVTFILVEILLSLIGGFSPIVTVWINGIFPGSFYLIFTLSIFSIGYLIGLEIPIIVRINEDYSKTLSINIGRVLSADYFGSLMGAFAFAFYLLANFPLTESPFLIGGVNFIVALIAFFVFWKKNMIKNPRIILALIVITIIALGIGFKFNRPWAENLEQRLYPYRITKAWQSPYQRIILLEKHNRGQVSNTLMINGNAQFNTADEPMYHEPLVLPIMELVRNSQQPLDILVLGGGDGMAVREILKYDKQYRNIRKILLVDLDPMMTKLFKDNPQLSSFNDYAFQNAKVITMAGLGISEGEPWELCQYNGKWSTPNDFQAEKVTDLSIMNLDADQFLDAIIGTWDAVIVDFPDPSTVELSKLYSKEFYMKVKRILKPRGMMVVQSTSPDKAKEAYQCIGRTIKSAGFNNIPYNQYVPTWHGLWGWWLAWSDEWPEELIQKEIERMEFKVPTKFLTGDMFRKQLVFGKDVRSGKPYFESAKFNKISTRTDPKIHHYYLKYCTW